MTSYAPMSSYIIEDKAQWRDKTKGLSNIVIINTARIVNGYRKAKEMHQRDRFLDTGGMKLYFVLI